MRSLAEGLDKFFNKRGIFLRPAPFLLKGGFAMPDGFFRMRVGEARPVFAQETVAIGTLTISSSPAPSVTLYDSTGAAVDAVTGVAATNYDTAALAAPRVWYILDASALAIGYYTLTFGFSAVGSDGSARYYAPNIEVQIVDVTE